MCSVPLNSTLTVVRTVHLCRVDHNKNIYTVFRNKNKKHHGRWRQRPWEKGKSFLFSTDKGTVFLLYEQGALHFHFAPSPPNYVSKPAYWPPRKNAQSLPFPSPALES